MANIKLFRNIILWVALTFSVFLLTAYLLARIYEPEIKKYFISCLNKELVSEIKVKDIRFTLLRGFPFASLEFSKVFIPSALSKKDTLLVAEKIFIQFRLPDIVRKKFIIRKVSARNGKLVLMYDRQNRPSFQIWKTETAGTDSLQFVLNSVLLEDMSVRYIRPSDDVSLDFYTGKFLVSGDISSAKRVMLLEGNITINNFLIDKENYLQKKSAALIAEVTASGDIYDIHNCRVRLTGSNKTNDIALDIAGLFDFTKEKSKYTLNISGKNQPVTGMIPLIPGKIQSRMKQYSPDGIISFNIIMKKEKAPVVSAKFQIRNGSISYLTDGTVPEKYFFDKINLTGRWSELAGRDPDQTSSSILTMDTFSVRMQNSDAAGKMKIKFQHVPQLFLSATARIPLNDMTQAFPENLNIQGGMLLMNVEYNGPLVKLNAFTKYEIDNATLTGKAKITDAGFHDAKSKMTVENLNAKFSLDNKDIKIQELSGKAFGGNIYIKGLLQNFLPFLLLPGGELYSDIKLRTDLIDLNQTLNDSTGKGDTAMIALLPDNINIDAAVDAGRLVWKKFEAENVNGKIKASGGRITISPVSFRALGGQATGKWFIDATQKGVILMSCEAEFGKIDIRKLFYSMDNFGQEYITEKHLRGIAAAKVRFASLWDERLNIIPEKAYASADITVSNGELVDFKPLEQLSSYIDVTELKDVKFSTLHNRIEVKEKKIMIPEMEIKSSALNLTASGVHTFDNEIDYKIKVALSEVLAKKAKKARKENEEFGVIEEQGGGMNLFLSMTGTVDEPVIKYDRKSAFVKMKNDLKEEKQNIKTIFHEEFGWLSASGGKKDSISLKKEKNKKETEPFIFEWE